MNFMSFAKYQALQKQGPMLFWPFQTLNNYFKVKKIFVHLFFFLEMEERVACLW